MNGAFRVRVGDVITVAVLVAVALGMTVAAVSVPYGAKAVVLVNGEPEAVLPLNEPGRVAVHGPLGDTIVEVDSEGVHITGSPCPQKLCIRMGHIRTRGQVLICVPNRVAVRIAGDTGEPAVDGVTG